MKPKVAFYWCASCGGCEEAVVDLGEKLLDVAAQVEIVFWPVALDFKMTDLERIPDGEIAAAFVNGAVRTSEQREAAMLLRRKSQTVIAFGSCAQLGGVPGLANLCGGEAILKAVYADGFEPAPELARFEDRVQPLDRVVDVDYYVPGCPPTPELLAGAVGALLSGTLPAKGSVLAPERALCDECPRRESRPPELNIARFYRPHEIVADQEKCLLAQGLLCLGAATRSGCGGRCINGNMPCTGCFGPTGHVVDFGGKALSAIASAARGVDGAEVEAALAAVADPAGTFYRYSLPASLVAVATARGQTQVAQ